MYVTDCCARVWLLPRAATQPEMRRSSPFRRSTALDMRTGVRRGFAEVLRSHRSSRSEHTVPSIPDMAKNDETWEDVVDPDVDGEEGDLTRMRPKKGFCVSQLRTGRIRTPTTAAQDLRSGGTGT